MLRFDHVGVVVADHDAVAVFFLGLRFEREGKMLVEGETVDKIDGLDGVRAEIMVVRSQMAAHAGTRQVSRASRHEGAQPLPANRLGFRHIAIEVTDLNTIVDGLRNKSFDTVGEVQDYEGAYRLCNVRGPEGLIVELAERIAS